MHTTLPSNKPCGMIHPSILVAIAFCRCLNIPARYCTGYLGDIGVPPSADPMDFSAWFEVFLGGRWYTFDARNNVPRIGRLLIARGRDAARRERLLEHAPVRVVVREDARRAVPEVHGAGAEPEDHHVARQRPRRPGNVNAIVEVPIRAVKGGAEANLPANAIQGIDGSLSLSAAVTNPSPTDGGSDRLAAAPSEADRQRLRGVVLELLNTHAEQQINDAMGERDLLLAGTLKIEQGTEETYEPAPGEPGNLLSLTMKAEFTAAYVRGDDLDQIADATLNAAEQAGFAPVPGTLSVKIVGTPRLKAIALPLQRTVDERNRLPNIVLFRHASFHQLTSVQDRAVVPSAECISDFVERRFGKLARQIHRHLPGKRDASRAAFAGHIGDAHVEVFRYASLNLFNGNGMSSFFLQNILQQMLYDFLRKLFPAQ